MLVLYGTPLSSPTNKIRFLLNALKTPYEFKIVNLAAGEQRSPEFLKINPYGKVPAINDNGFTLAESNAIIRYLADKNNSSLYPKELKERAIVDQWIDYASSHIAMATSKVFFNTHIYKMLNGVSKDERSLQDGTDWLKNYLPVVDAQLAKNAYIAGNQLTLADIAMLAALDVAEVIDLNLKAYTHIAAWRKKLVAEKFYQDCHASFEASFKAVIERRAQAMA